MYEIIKVERLKNMVNKYDVSIVVNNIDTLEKLKDIIETEIVPKMKKEYDFDELYLGFFEDENLIGYGTTLGYVICSPTGDFTGKYKLNSDWSNLKIGYKNIEHFEENWNNRLSHKEAIIFKEIRRGFTNEKTEGDIEKENSVISKVAKDHNISSGEANKIIFKHARHFCK
ncbi:hypothetical protein [Clostridium sporogenes]|uniref:hypothetical protein n=1 Tax=Clostridium sporogenes TaxID=1509 RepID=UPI0013D3EAC8|nr:hypothetical protein [Clostridium sporogenes]NFH40804.1 hypothetical protein [Clostridium sporogenes]